MRIRKILGVLSILAVFIFVLTGCSKYSDIRGTYKRGSITFIIEDKEIKQISSDGQENDRPIYYDRLGENLIRMYSYEGRYTYYYVYEGGIIYIGSSTFPSGGEYTKE